MKTIGITLKPYAYTPEAYAYEKYLSQHGWDVQLDYELDPDNDVNIYFMGMRPFWQEKQGRALEIHEYQSLSTPPYAKVKNFLKTLVNRSPKGRIFLNDIVHRGLSFDDNIPYIYRDMGVDEEFFQKPSENPDFDIIYCGSISGRVGLIDVLLKLSKRYKIIVVGSVSNELIPILNKGNITLTGRVERKDIPELYRNVRFGLNYTPDIYPFNIQTSTKTLEYLASGLQVISNKYEWVENFFAHIQYEAHWVDLEKDFEFAQNSIIPNMSMFKWSHILDKSEFNNFLEKLK